MTQKKVVLGRGMAALLGSSMANPLNNSKNPDIVPSLSKMPAAPEVKKTENESQETGTPLLVPVNKIRPNTHQPRRVFKDEEIVELANSIRENGIIQPLVVVASEDGKSFELIAGERRWRAAQKVGLERVPVVIKKVTKKDKLAMAIIENVQRSNLNCVEEALAYFQLLDEFNLTQEEVAKKIGKDRSTIANMLRLLKLPKEVIIMLQKEQLSFGHGKLLAGMENKDHAIEWANKAIEGQFSVRELEKFLKEDSNPTVKPKNEKTKQPVMNEQKYNALKDKLERKTGFHFDVKAKKNGAGDLIIKFNNVEEFNSIYEFLLK
jgi:ParB family chromosome partitioning protein